MRTEKSSWKCRQTLVALAFLMLSACVIPVNAAESKDYAVLVEAKVTVNPPAITLSWPLEAKATGYEIYRKLRTEKSWGTVIKTVAGTEISWTDTTVTVGTIYEYQVKRLSKISGTQVLGMTPSAHGLSHAEIVPTTTLSSLGYVCGGINIPAIDNRGTVILVVDNTMAIPLSNELTRLRDDLVGDGWSVIRHDVGRADSVVSVKALIKADYDAAPTEVKSVFLFGHIPVARSGDIAPTGHPSPVHQGAFPADLYYGDMDGVWTDNTVNDVTGGNNVPGDPPGVHSCWNVPGDGKFDQSYIPSGSWDIEKKVWGASGKVELQVGRVDLWGLTTFAPKTETDLLRQYLNKDHAHRHAVTVLPRRGLITDKFKEFGGQAFAQSGWRAWSSLFGAANITEGEFDALNVERYLGYYLCGGGYNNSCDSVTTAKIAKQDPKAAFFMMFGSHFGDWNYTENFLRAPLATSCGLVSVYSGKPFWYMHTMALGGTTGEVTQLVQNNTVDDLTKGPLYGPAQGAAGEVHIALMGDPTLRLFAVVPVTNVTAKNGKGDVAINWIASTDTVVGYNVYRSTSANGPFTRITNKALTGTSFIDATIKTGIPYTYMVRAIKLETSAGGTYYNLSQGIFVTTTLGG